MLYEVVNMLGIYVSYNAEKNGNFEEAIKMSNEGYIIWKHGFPCIKELNYPSKILIRMASKGSFYIGDLLLIRNYEDINPKVFTEDIHHRPSNWRVNSGESKTVLFISNLKEISEPDKVKNQHPPQGIIYHDFT